MLRLGDPWLFERVNAAIELPTPKEPNLQARMNALRRQVEEMVEQKGEYTAMPQARAQTMHYMKGLKGAAALRRCCCTLSRLEDLDELIAAVFEEQRKAGLDPDDVREVPFRDHSLRVSSSRFWVKQGRQCAMNQSASGQCIPSSASRC